MNTLSTHTDWLVTSSESSTSGLKEVTVVDPSTGCHVLWLWMIKRRSEMDRVDDLCLSSLVVSHVLMWSRRWDSHPLVQVMARLCKNMVSHQQKTCGMTDFGLRGMTQLASKPGMTSFSPMMQFSGMS